MFFLMKLYHVELSNYLDDSTQSILILSCEPLAKNSASLDRYFDKDWFYVSSVNVAKILTNEWTEQEYNEMIDIINKLG